MVDGAPRPAAVPYEDRCCICSGSAVDEAEEGVPMLEDPIVVARRDFFDKYLDMSKGKGLEIGPGFNPTYPKSLGFPVLALDHLPTEQLVQKYTSDPNVSDEMVQRIESVDLVWSGGSYALVSGLPSELNFAVACHVIEHSESLIGFLGGMAEILGTGGLLCLAIPDRDSMFDFFRPMSTLGDVVLADLDPSLYTLKALIDQANLASSLNGQIAWPRQVVEEASFCSDQLEFLTNEREALEQIRELVRIGPPEDYRDAHRWVFSPESFLHLIAQLNALGLSPFEFVDTTWGVGCEFLVVLKRVEGNSGREVAVPGDRSSFRELSSVRQKLNFGSSEVGAAVRLGDYEDVVRRLDAVLGSTSWRLTKPMRRAKDALKAWRSAQ